MSRTRAELFAQCARDDQLRSEVLARAVAGGYALVGPSARAWSVDPATGIPAGPASDAEHHAIRQLTISGHLDGAEPVWLRCADGGDEVVSAVIPAQDEDDGTDVDNDTDPVEYARQAVDDLTADTDTDTDDDGAAMVCFRPDTAAGTDCSTYADDAEGWSR